MSESIPEKGVCRIDVENNDKYDCLLDAESDVEMYEIISVEDSDVEDDKREECEKQRDLKRKSEDVGRVEWRCNASQGEEDGKRIRTEKMERLMMETSDDTTEESIVQQKIERVIETGHGCEKRLSYEDTLQKKETSEEKRPEKNNQVIERTKTPIETISLLDQEDSTMEMSPLQPQEVEQNEEAEPSESYLQMTNTVRRLTEGLGVLRNHDSIKGICPYQHEKFEGIIRTALLDTSQPMRDITQQATAPLEMTGVLTNKENGIARHFQPFPQTYDLPKIIPFEVPSQVTGFIQQVQPPLEMVSSLGNKTYEVSGHFVATPQTYDISKAPENPLRMFRFNRGEEVTTEETVLQKQQVEEGSRTGPFNTSPPLLNGTCTSSQQSEIYPSAHDELSNSSLQLSEDAFNIKMAAEALSLLRNNGRPFYETEEENEYVQTGPHPSIQISDAAICTALHKNGRQQELKLTDPTLQVSLKDRNQPSSDVLESSASNHRVLFDTTLEITDTATGAKIPLESLYLNANQNMEIESRSPTLQRRNFEKDKSHALPDAVLQLLGNVTCVKVPLDLIIPRERERIESEMSAIQETKSCASQFMQTSNAATCVQFPLQEIRNQKITEEEMEFRHSPFQKKNLTDTGNRILSNTVLQFPNPLTYVKMPLEGYTSPGSGEVAKSIQMSNALTCVNFPLNAVRMSGNQENTRERQEFRYATLQGVPANTDSAVVPKIFPPMSHPSIYVNIPLESVHLPKNAATGVIIPLQDDTAPRMKDDEIESRYDFGSQQRAENNPHNLNAANKISTMQDFPKDPHASKNIRAPTPRFNIKEQWRSFGNVKSVVPSLLLDTKNIKLPLEPRLRKIRNPDSQNQTLEEIRNHHSSIQVLPVTESTRSYIPIDGTPMDRFNLQPQQLGGTRNKNPSHVTSQINTTAQGSSGTLVTSSTQQVRGFSPATKFTTSESSNSQQQQAEEFSSAYIFAANGSSVQKDSNLHQQKVVGFSVAPKFDSNESSIQRSPNLKEKQVAGFLVVPKIPSNEGSMQGSLHLQQQQSGGFLVVPKFATNESSVNATQQQQVGWFSSATPKTITQERAYIPQQCERDIPLTLPKSVVKENATKECIHSATPKIILNESGAQGCSYLEQQHVQGVGEPRHSPTQQEIVGKIEGVSLSHPDPNVPNLTKGSNTFNLANNGEKTASSQRDNIRVGPSGEPSHVLILTKNIISPQNPINLPKYEDTTKEQTKRRNSDGIGNNKLFQSSAQMSNVNSETTVKTPLEAFSLLISDDMIRRILTYTNVKLSRMEAKSKSRNCFKKQTNEIELRAFLGLLLISGALKQNTATVPEIWSECFGAGIYRATLHEPRFQVLSQSICFGDSTSRDKCIIKDEFTRIGDLWEEYLNNCKKYSLPLLHIKPIEKTVNTTTEADETGDDEAAQLYSTARKTVNMPLRILFSMLDGAGVRGLSMFRRANPSIKMCQREFLKQVGMSLVRPQLRTRLLKKTLRTSIRELIESILNKKSEIDNSVGGSNFLTDSSLIKQKRCQLCNWNKDRKTKFQCSV